MNDRYTAETTPFPSEILAKVFDNEKQEWVVAVYIGTDPDWVVETLNARIEHESYRAEIDAVRVKEQAAGNKMQEERDWYKQQMDKFVRENSGLRRSLLDMLELLNQKNSIVAYYDNRD